MADGRIVPCPTRRARRSRPRGAAKSGPQRRSKSSAWCATSTSRCTCRCATRTRRGSCRSPTLRDGDIAQVEGVVARLRGSSSGRAASSSCAIARRQRRPGAALPPLLSVAPEGARGRHSACACAARRAAASSGSRWCTRLQGVDADTPLPTALTPVYPTSAQLPQAYLRKAVAAGAARAPTSTRSLPPALLPRRPADAARGARAACTSRRPSVDAGGARRPQPPGLAAPEVRRAAGAAAVAAAGASASASASARRRSRLRAAGCTSALLAALPFALTAAQRRVGDEIAADLQRGRADAPPAAGRRRLGQDGRRRARRGDRDRRRLAVRADGADRDPRRAAPAQAGRLARAARRHASPGSPAAARARRATQMLEQVASGEAGARRRHARGDPGAGARSRGSAWRSSTSSTASACAAARAARASSRDAGRPRAAPADDERDADPAHAGDDAVRRPRRQHDRRAAARPHAGRHQAVRRRASATR